HLLLGAVELGLGACFFGLFGQEPAVLAALGVPEGWRAVGTVALGQPAPDADEPGRSSSRGRRTVEDVLHRGAW
ncbi:MAG TPA: nitroreductase family protein, partial [Acidimicrobiales bacterium]|nr:nitroreductase family protein [Acidimicrobiales bacterium]